MKWLDYEVYLDRQIKDAEYNLDHAYKAYRQAKARFHQLMEQKRNFEKALEEKMHDVEKGVY